MTEQLIKRGIFQSFDPIGYTASVLIIEATSYTLSGVPVATSIDGSSALSGSSCAVLFLDANNPEDAVVLAIYGAAPDHTPGRVIFVPPFLQINAVTINAGVTNTYSVTSASSGIPSSARGVLCRAFFSSATVGAWVGIAPHSGAIGSYCVLGNLQVASQSVNGNALVPLDSNGQLDVKANTGNCTVTLYTYGYVL